MDPLPLSLPTHARWAADVRGEGRAVKVAAHVEAGFLVLSTWKADICVGTVRLVPHEASDLMAGIAECLAELTGDPCPPAAAGEVDRRLRELEQRLEVLEQRGA